MKTLKRRRKERKTDYKKRLNLLKCGSPRIVFRKTNKYIITQYVKSREAKDSVIIGLTSGSLIKYGWPEEFKGSLKSVPASYLTGFLVGKKIIKEKLETPIIDLGMLRAIHKNKIFAFIKGVRDSGLNIACDEKTFPKEDRIKGKHLKKDFSGIFDKIKSKIESELK